MAIKNQPTTLYKFLRTGLKSENGDCVWKKGIWKKHNDDLSMCRSGFHASTRIIDALSYVKGEVLVKVEVKGNHLEQEDKQVWSEMKIVKTWKWTKTDSVELAIYVAELALPYFEKEYPNDDRPRKAIEAAKAYLKNPNDNAPNAAAYAAYAAYAAAHAAGAAHAAANAAHAAYAAYAAANAVHAANATNAAANAAYAAAHAAGAAHAARATYVTYVTYAAHAADAATNEILDQIENWLLKRFK